MVCHFSAIRRTVQEIANKLMICVRVWCWRGAGRLGADYKAAGNRPVASHPILNLMLSQFHSK